MPSAENVGLPSKRPYDLPPHVGVAAEIAEQLGDKTSTVLDTYTHVINAWRGRAGVNIEAEIRRARERIT